MEGLAGVCAAKDAGLNSEGKNRWKDHTDLHNSVRRQEGKGGDHEDHSIRDGRIRSFHSRRESSQYFFTGVAQGTIDHAVRDARHCAGLRISLLGHDARRNFEGQCLC